MYTGTLPPISRRETYSETLHVIDDDGDLFDLTGANVIVEISRGGWRTRFEVPDTKRSVVISGPGTIDWRFEAESLTGCAPGTARLYVFIKRDTDTVQILAVDLPILE